jgi:hypothetical protein
MGGCRVVKLIYMAEPPSSGQMVRDLPWPPSIHTGDSGQGDVRFKSHFQIISEFLIFVYMYD